MACRVGARTLHLEELHRFPNGAVPVHGSLFWDVLGIHREVLAGIREVARTGALHGHRHRLVGDRLRTARPGRAAAREPAQPPGLAHRRRTRAGAHVPSPTRSCTTSPGCSSCSSTRSTSWRPRLGTPALEAAERLLLLPDLLTYWLTGEVGAERTNASTTGLYDVRTRDWSLELAKRIGLPWSILPAAARTGRCGGSGAGRGGGVRRRVRRTRHRGRLPRHRVRGGRRTRRARSRSPTSPRAPGRWSGSSSRRRCSPRTRGSRTSPTRAASTGPSGS